MEQPVILEVAVNGGTTKARNPHTPINVELVRRAVAACEQADRMVATPAHAAEILGLRTRVPAAA